MKFHFIAAFFCLLAASAEGAQTAGTLARIKTSGVVTMGVRESSGALSYAVRAGHYDGYHVELCRRIIANLEKTVGRKLSIKYQPVTAQNRIALLQGGTVDIECGSTTNTMARSQEVSFLLTTFVEEVRMAVRADSGIASMAHLNGKSVVTTAGTTSVQTLRRSAKVSRIDFKEIHGREHAHSFRLLESGSADAFVMDGSILAGSIASASNPADFRIVGEVLSVEPIAIMVRKEDTAFKKIGDSTIREMIKAGDMARLWNKWFMQPIAPKNTRIGLPVSESTKIAWRMPNDNPMEDYRR